MEEGWVCYQEGAPYPALGVGGRCRGCRSRRGMEQGRGCEVVRWRGAWGGRSCLTVQQRLEEKMKMVGVVEERRRVQGRRSVQADHAK